MEIRAIIIDDERKAVEILKNRIKKFCPNISLIAETQDPEEGIELINSLNPQLVFLDIAMPRLSGFELLARIEQPVFEVIFVTAFDQYAIDAIKHCAIGYLVKPIDKDDLILAVGNAIKNIVEKTAAQKNRLLLENQQITLFQNKKITLPTQEGLEFVKISDIIHCEGSGGYTKIYTLEKKILFSSLSIGHFGKLLENQEFYLVHKSHLINLSHINKYLNEGYVVLTHGHKIPVSRGKRKAFILKIRS
ncbi:LytR/AlgR family response regulator transcription factor [Aureispira anguillae]|uniref:LytTR family DNA-binding domain-containing protein n=1 Tax=Aureispira anguillae TaxID=2864201 RepID=A0A916DT32_9BACT|nr:LytTR family DNA-binding domain-containing protein [Aureispira anguillae]BDS12291.1 LytTR family DNA-binding domain-containing protein [Aureispira anguillae]